MGEKLQSTQGRKEERAGACVKRGTWGVTLGDGGKAEEGPQWRSGLEGKQAESQLHGHSGIIYNPPASQARSALKTGGLREDFHSHTGRE